MMKEFDMETWGEVEAAIPEFTSTETLGQFNLRKGKPLPKRFKVLVNDNLLVK